MSILQTRQATTGLCKSASVRGFIPGPCSDACAQDVLQVAAKVPIHPFSAAILGWHAILLKHLHSRLGGRVRCAGCQTAAGCHEQLTEPRSLDGQRNVFRFLLGHRDWFRSTRQRRRKEPQAEAFIFAQISGISDYFSREETCVVSITGESQSCLNDAEKG